MKDTVLLVKYLELSLVQSVEFSYDNTIARYTGYYRLATNAILPDCTPWKSIVIFLYSKRI